MAAAGVLWGGLRIHPPLPTAVNQGFVTAENNTAFSIRVTEADGAGRRRKRGRAEFLRTPWNQQEIITQLRRKCVTKHKRDGGKMTEKEGDWKSYRGAGKTRNYRRDGKEGMGAM